jgi:polyhydroxybutyrate depolymerase
MRGSTPGLIALVLLAGCSSSSHAGSGGPDASTAHDASAPPDATADVPIDALGMDDVPPFDAAAILAARPEQIHVPSSYAAGTPTPVVFMFHGYSTSGAIEEAYVQLTAASDAHGFLYVYGDGTVDHPPEGGAGNRFWNATNACCDFYDSGVNDVQYFDAMLADVEARYTVDPKRVYAFGHSNGGFMSHRLACDRAAHIAAILSLEGATWFDQTRCEPSQTVSVAEIHGDADMTIAYDGGLDRGVPYPGAPATVTDWAAKDGCTGALADTGQTLALVGGLTTTVSAFSGCPKGVDVQLWTVHGGSHIPALDQPGWGDIVWTWLSSHAKP